VAAIPAAGREQLVGTKNKGGKNTKKAAGRTLKEKRGDKRAKKDSDRGNQSGLSR
jgi:hypothetical protein